MTKRKLLVIDDEPDIARLIGQVAEGMGYETRTAANAQQFRTCYAEFQPDVVVLDVVMPETDGIELVQYLADIDCRSRILVISGYAQRYLDNTKSLGKALGLASVTAMTKPIELPRLEAFLNIG